MDSVSKKIIFVHPAIRPYRVEFFEYLSAHRNIEFIFVEDYQDNIVQISSGIKLRQWQAYQSTGFLGLYKKGFTLRLLKDVLCKSYDIWVSSGLFHVSTHLAVLFVRLRGKKFYIFSEDWLFSESLKHAVFKPIAKLVAKASAGIICASEHSRKFFMDLGVSKEKLFLARNATSDYAISDTDAEVGKSIAQKYFVDTVPVILYLGRVVEYKGLDILIRAFADVEKQALAKLLVVGEGGFLDSCKKLVSSLEVKNVTFVGQSSAEETKFFYHFSKLFVLPARFMRSSNVVSEAWGFTINEALSAGLPVITTEAAAASELISDGVNGFVVKSEDVHELRDKILTVLGSIDQFRQHTRQVFKEVNPVLQAESFIYAIDL